MEGSEVEKEGREGLKEEGVAYPKQEPVSRYLTNLTFLHMFYLPSSPSSSLHCTLALFESERVKGNFC